MKLIEILGKELVGKKLRHKNSHNREVELAVESVETKYHTLQITPDTQENDYYGDSCSWTTIKISFIDGSSIEVELNSELAII